MTLLNKNMLVALGIVILSTLSTQSNATVIELNTVSTNELGSSFDLVISISDLTANDLSSFYIDLGFDSSLLDFTGYTLGTTLIDSFWGQDDYSGGETSTGIINISELSWLLDFSTQPSNFILATLSFTSVSAGIADFFVDDYDLTDENNATMGDVTTDTASVSVSAVAEPTSIALILMALLGVSFVRRKA